jgi:8-amino-7-oxononanoate synthase
MRHPSRSLRPWPRLTTGVPAALATPVSAVQVAQTLASLQGCERGVLAPSTLHLFWDLFGILSGDGVVIYMDAGVYPIARWGVERAAGRGVVVRCFAHHDSDALYHLLKRDAHRRTRPLVVTDGWCTRCGKPAPIAAYLAHAREFGGRLLMDDTQALGILGDGPDPDTPYGRGGGGLLRWFNIEGPDVLVVSSLAKGLGVPVAVLAGSEAEIRRFEAQSETQMHCSPPSAAVVHAVEHALALNRQCGDALRRRLAQLVHRFRNRLAKAGFSARGGIFPVQVLTPVAGIGIRTLHTRLLRLGVRTVLLRAHSGQGAELSFLINARHSPGDIDYAMEALAHTVGAKSPKRYQWR